MEDNSIIIMEDNSIIIMEDNSIIIIMYMLLDILYCHYSEWQQTSTCTMKIVKMIAQCTTMIVNDCFLHSLSLVYYYNSVV